MPPETFQLRCDHVRQHGRSQSCCIGVCRIAVEMDRGITILRGYGHFTKEEREVLYCVVARNEIVRLKNIINSVDPHAFVSLMEVHDVMGEGFTLDEEKQPIG